MKNALAAVNQPETGVRKPVSEGVNFGETIGASFAYKYAPIANFFEVGGKFGFAPLPEDGYTARDNIPDDLKAFGSTLLSATNPEHMTLLVGQIRKGQENRRIAYESGFVPNFIAEFFDPINYVALPFSAAKTFGQAALRTGASTAAVVSAQEAIRYPLDPLGTKGEVALNIGASFVLGGLLGGAIGTPARNRVKAQEHGAKQIKLLREAIEPIDGVELDPNIAQSIFTDSWLFTAVTTPMKRVLMDQSVPNSVKIRTLAIANDSGILLAGNKKGQKFGNSVFQEAKLHEGEWVSVHDDLMEIWGRTTGDGVTSPMDYMPKRKEFNNWLAGIDEKAIRRTTPANDLEASAIKKLNSFYENWEVRLRDEGMIGSRKFYEGFVAKREAKLAGVQKRLTAKVSPEHRSRLEAQVTRYSDEIDEAKQTIQDLKDAGPITPPNEGVFRPRYWDFDYIRANRDEFTQVLTDWFSANPSIYARNTKSKKFERIDLSSDKQSISKRVNDMIDGLLDDTDPLNPDGMYYGMGKSKHMKHRTLDIPNELVLNFMVRNPVSVMKAYVSKTAARYEFSRKFNGESIDDILDDTFSEMMVAGSNAEQAHAVMKDMRHLYDRVAGTVLRSPDALNQKTATIMRDLAQLNYLGSAGLSTITEPAKIIMEHGLGPTMKGLFNVLTDNQLKLGAKEVRVAGESLENLMGNAHMRLVEDLNNNPLRTTYMDKTKNAFYMLNGLGPITRILKDFDGMMRSHTLIDYSVRWTQGKASKMEQEYLLRYNINLEDAHKIANAPWQKSSSGMYMANTEAWSNTIEFPSTRADIVSGPTNSYVQEKQQVKTSEAGYSRDEIKKTVMEGVDEDLAYHVTNNPKLIMDKGFNRGGATVGQVHFDEGYGEYITVFDIRDIKEQLGIPKSESLKTSYQGRSGDPAHKNDFAEQIYGEASSIVGKDGYTKTDVLKGKRPIAVFHITELPDLMMARKAGARSEDLDDGLAQTIHAQLDRDLLYARLTGEDISKVPNWEQMADTLDDLNAYIDKELSFIKYYKDFAPLEKTETINVNGRYKPAFYRESENKIYIDEEYILDTMWEQRGWENPRQKGVTPIESGIINSPEDLVTFVKMHEIMHTIHSAKALGFDKLTKAGRAGYENAINDLAVVEIKQQARVDPETVKTFRNALSSGVLNTILMGTPADKPIITDGIVYIPMRVAKQFGMKEDSAYKGYARIENGLLGLPFQFFSYALAAVNKTTAAYGHGQLKSQYIGTAIAMGLGYMSLQIKTPDYVEMSYSDQFARSFDYSGVATIYSDMFYTAMNTVSALGGPNITGGLLQPKFPQKPSTLDAATGLLGAGPSISTDLARGMYELTTGNVGKGSGEIIRNLPFARLWFLKSKINEMTNMLESELDGPTGLGRF